ncbi:MAG: hypothetical protein MET45_09200 [Nostoc sp. LLA-1]|nr:hypothetical protein [Cyanocohniella sp. LLY]
MSSPAVITIVKMLESLPVEIQEQVVDHLREYLENLQDEMKWNQLFQHSQSKLVAAAQKAKQEITEGKATAMDYDQL